MEWEVERNEACQVPVERFSELQDLQIGQGNEIIIPVISCVIGVIDRLEILDAGGPDVWLDQVAV